MKEQKTEKTFIEKEKEDCREFAEVLKRIPTNRKREAKALLEGFALCAESEKMVV